MNITFGLVAILASLGCLLLFFVVRSPHATINAMSHYQYYSLAGAILFFAAGVFAFYRHWRFEQDGDDSGEMV